MINPNNLFERTRWFHEVCNTDEHKRLRNNNEMRLRALRELKSLVEEPFIRKFVEAQGTIHYWHDLTFIPVMQEDEACNS